MQKKLAFSEQEYKQRIERVRSEMSQNDLDALIVCDPRNIRYLSGFHTYGYWDPIALIVLNEGDPIHFTLDFEARNVDILSWTSNWDGYNQWQDPVVRLRDVLKERLLDKVKIGIEKQAWFLTVHFYEALCAALPTVNFHDGSRIVDRVRFIKSPQELTYLRKSGKATVAASQAAIDACGENRTEEDVATAIYQALILSGSEPSAIPPLVNAGYRSSLPHAIWGGKLLEHGDLVFFELSGCIEGYHAPICRVAVIGDCGNEQKRIANTCIEAVEMSLSLVKPGVPMGKVDEVARGVFREANLDEYFRTPIGYPVGMGFPIFWGEQPANPTMLQGEETVLEEGMVFHMIPSIQNYELADQGGGHITISSTIAVTKDGYELLTDFPRKLFFK